MNTSTTNDQRICGLQSLGYSFREASFLIPAALQSGYFLRRQYAASSGKAPGYADVALGEKVLRRGHAKVMTMRHNRMLYHLCSKPFYAAIGEEDNRNRRKHEPQAITRRLMAFDFALANDTQCFLPTEAEKLAFFSGRLGISEAHLPQKLYRSTKNGSATLRYFVDKSPIYIDPIANENYPLAHFGFVDEGHHSTSAFEQYLREYRPLFARLERFEMVYIASLSVRFAAARQLFGRLIGQEGLVPVDPLVLRIIEYFTVRAAYDRRDMGGLSQQKLIQLRADRAEFSDVKYERLFAQWKSDGDSAITAELCPESIAKPAQIAQFRTHLLPFKYEVFSSAFGSKSEGKQA